MLLFYFLNEIFLQIIVNLNVYVNLLLLKQSVLAELLVLWDKFFKSK